MIITYLSKLLTNKVSGPLPKPSEAGRAYSNCLLAAIAQYPIDQEKNEDGGETAAAEFPGSDPGQ